MRQLERLLVPPRSGESLVVRCGQVLRVLLPDGPQVVDFNAFRLENLKESFSSSVTRAYQAVHPTTGHRLLSRPPFERPMFKIVEDTMVHEVSARGAKSHDLLYGRCSRAYRLAHYGVASPGCQENIAGAIAKFGLQDSDVHDAFNIFMRTGIGEDGKLFFEASDSRQDDYIVLEAEMDCLVGISTCPGQSSGPVSHAVAFEIYASRV